MNGKHDDPSTEIWELHARIQELESELRARDEFIIAAAHELRNPISPLMLHVHRLESASRKATDGTVQAEWLSGQLEVLGRRLTRFLSALNRILDVSSINSGRIQLIEEPVDLAEVVADVVAGFERELAAARSTLTLEISGPVHGTWDRMRLEQIVSNLVSNAIRYGDGQPIAVSLRELPACALGPAGALVPAAELVVADQGIGIPASDQARIFQRFERAHSKFRGGFGVGLWMVQQLCEAMGGSVALKSASGGGSAFSVILPTNRDGSGDDG